jgi:hypothetical protein
MEMQKAAQKVQEENKLLRAVLHNQGFDDAGIQHAMDAVKRAASGQVTPQYGSSMVCDLLSLMYGKPEMNMKLNLTRCK